jgi:hypothetical protein
MIVHDPDRPVTHAHGQHGMHEHTPSDYAAHQRPIDGERIHESAPPARREATQAERNIAGAWAAQHRWTNPRDEKVEYEHALAILVFANARPPLKNPIRGRR